MVYGVLIGGVTMISIFFGQVVSPMILAFLVVMAGVVVMVYLGLLFPIYWLSYIVLLTFLGGLLVVFVYVASLCPNEPVVSSSKWLIVIMVSAMLVFGWDWWSSSDLMYYGGFGDLGYLMKMYYSGVEGVISLLIVYLLLVLLVVVDLSLVFEGSLSVNYGKSA